MRPKVPSLRIRSLVASLRPRQAVYDLCCDHGLIGLLAWEQEPSRRVYFVDQSDEALIPLQTELAKPRYHTAPFEVLSCRAEDLVLEQPCNIVIAGVGNATIIRILDSLFPVSLDPNRLVLCSQQQTDPLKAYLKKRAWPLVELTSIIERGRSRKILVVELSPAH